MSAMEQSLRRALEAGDATDAAFRDSIYSASERALERMLASKDIDPETAQAQRIRLAETINLVEDDYFAASGAAYEAPSDITAEEAEPADDAGSPELAHDLHSAAPERGVPSHPASDDDAPAEPDPGADDHGSEETRSNPLDAPAAALPWTPGRRARVSPETGRFGRLRPFLFGLGVLLFALVAGLLFFYTTVFGGMDTASTAAAAPETIVADTSGTTGAAVEDENWIVLFEGTQLEAISTPSGGRVAAITGEGDVPAVRVAAPAAAAAATRAEIQISIGPGVVNTIEGRTVRVEIVAGSPDARQRQFSVRCLFGGDSVCGRQRFTAQQARETFVFDMVVPTNPSASGEIAIAPGLGKTGKNLDLYSVRLRGV